MEMGDRDDQGLPTDSLIQIFECYYLNSNPPPNYGFRLGGGNFAVVGYSNGVFLISRKEHLWLFNPVLAVYRKIPVTNPDGHCCLAFSEERYVVLKWNYVGVDDKSGFLASFPVIASQNSWCVKETNFPRVLNRPSPVMESRIYWVSCEGVISYDLKEGNLLIEPLPITVNVSNKLRVVEVHGKPTLIDFNLNGCFETYRRMGADWEIIGRYYPDVWLVDKITKFWGFAYGTFFFENEAGQLISYAGKTNLTNECKGIGSTFYRWIYNYRESISSLPIMLYGFS